MEYFEQHSEAVIRVWVLIILTRTCGAGEFFTPTDLPSPLDDNGFFLCVGVSHITQTT